MLLQSPVRAFRMLVGTRNGGMRRIASPRVVGAVVPLLAGTAGIAALSAGRIGGIARSRGNGSSNNGGFGMQLKEFITRNPHGIQRDDTVLHAAEQMRRHGFGALLVFDQERLVGLVTDRDILVGCMAAGHDAGNCEVREHMTAGPIPIGPDATIEDALTKMADAQVRRLVVMDQDDVVGIVSLGDLAVRCADHALVGRTLAEISQPIRQPIPS